MQNDPSASLVRVLRERGSLLDGDDALLRTAAAQGLDAQAQLRWLAQNRRVGLVVTSIAGGLRLVLLVGAAIAILALGTRGDVPIGVPIGIALALAAVVGWLAPKLARRVRELGRPLPSWEEIATLVERG